MCPEATNPGKNNGMQPMNPVTYTMTFKGNTLVDIAPRPSGIGYPLYHREAERNGVRAPMDKVIRYISNACARAMSSEPRQ